MNFWTARTGLWGLLVSLFAWTACKEPDKSDDRIIRFLSVSDFRIDSTALHDEEEIEVLCASDFLFGSDKVDYYVHAIVVSMETGDTVNVLATGVLDAKENDRFRNYLSESNVFTRVMSNHGHIADRQNVNTLKTRKSEKVHSDEQYINLPYKNYPAVIGSICEIQHTTDGLKLDDPF